MRLDVDDGHIDPRYERALGNRTGLVNRIGHFIREQSAPRGFSTAPELADFEEVTGLDGIGDLGVGGKGFDMQAALVSCLGEVFERYSNLWTPSGRFVEATHRELAEDGRNVVEYDYLDVFGDTLPEETFRPFDRDTRIQWVRGRNLLTGETVHLPAKFVWMYAGQVGEKPVFPGSSNGLAAGRTLHEALLGSILEQIERDGFLRTWLRQSPKDRVAVDGSLGYERTVSDFCPAEDIEVRLIEHESIVDVPVVGVCLVNRADVYPKFLIGGDADIDPERAITSALAEGAQGWPFLFSFAGEMKSETDLSAVLNFTDNVDYYARPSNFEEVSFLFEQEPTTPEWTKQPKSPSSRAGRLRECLDRLDAACCSPIAVEVTSPDVAELGVRVTRVFIPECLQLVAPSTLPIDHPTIEDEVVTDKAHPFP